MATPRYTRSLMSAPKSGQRGGALIFGLAMLIVLTILGVSSAGSSSLQLKMSGNAIGANRTFQAAERARQRAEQFAHDKAEQLRGGTVQYSCSAAAGLLADPTLVTAIPPSPYVDAATCSATTGLVADIHTYGWTSGSTAVASLDATDLTDGRYIVEYLGARAIAPDRNSATRDTDPKVNAHIFRLSIRGSDGAGGETYVRSFYLN